MDKDMDIGGLTNAITSLDQSYNPTDVYNKVTTQLGIPDARTRVQALSSNLANTENAIRAVDPNVTARTSNSLVTEAQRGRLVNMEKAPLTDTYSQQNQAYGKESGNLNSLTQQAAHQTSLAADDYKNKRQSLAEQLSTAIQQQHEAQRRAEADRAFNQSVSQFNANLAETRANRAAVAASSSRGSSTPAASPAAQQRAGGGYNFQDASGKAISAQTFAALTNTPLNSLLQQMASKGDKGAADVIKNGTRSAAYKAITWG